MTRSVTCIYHFRLDLSLCLLAVEHQECEIALDKVITTIDTVTSALFLKFFFSTAHDEVDFFCASRGTRGV